MTEPLYTVEGFVEVVAWETRHNPPPVLQRAVYRWVDGLFFDPEQEPSQPVERDAPHDLPPARAAEIPGTWVTIQYVVDGTVVRILKVEPRES